MLTYPCPFFCCSARAVNLQGWCHAIAGGQWAHDAGRVLRHGLFGDVWCRNWRPSGKITVCYWKLPIDTWFTYEGWWYSRVIYASLPVWPLAKLILCYWKSPSVLHEIKQIYHQPPCSTFFLSIYLAENHALSSRHDGFLTWTGHWACICQWNCGFWPTFLWSKWWPQRMGVGHGSLGMAGRSKGDCLCEHGFRMDCDHPQFIG